MGRFGRSETPDDTQLRETGTRVPAILVERKQGRSEYRGGRDGNRLMGHPTKMRWKALTPEGGMIEFEVKAKWGPAEGICLEAACDDAREHAVLLMDLPSMNHWDLDQQAQITEWLNASNAAGKALMPPEDGLPRDVRAAMQRYRAAQARDAAVEGTSLKDLLGDRR